jgi:hypothetical protein
MNTRTYIVEFKIFGLVVNEAVIEIHQDVFDTVNDDWRSVFYDLHTNEEIACHIAYNMIVNRLLLDRMDGWAHLPASHAHIKEWPILTDWELAAREVWFNDA